MPSVYELHLQEGFTGESIEVLADDAVVGAFEARTRMQVGYARIERLALSPGQKVTVRVKNPPRSESIMVEEGKEFILINLPKGQLSLTTTDKRPGYA